MEYLFVPLTLGIVIWIYFTSNPLSHSRWFMVRRFINWFPLGMTYAFLYMGRYNLTVTKNALGVLMTKEDFGLIFGIGTLVYGCSFLLNGPLVDRYGGKLGMIVAAVGSSLANIALGVVTYLYLNHRLTTNMTATFAFLYSANMFFQSYGAVSIIKVKAYWFHVRERGIFGAIFGTLISFGVYFAFDWGKAIADAAKANLANPTGFQSAFRTLFALDVGSSGVDATWLVFFIPAGLLMFWALLDWVCIKDTPEEANFPAFDTHDASSGEMDRDYGKRELLKKIFTSPVIMGIAFVEFTTGVIRNSIMQWYLIFAHDVKQPGGEFFLEHWGLLLCVTGILGGFMAGYLSDKIFHSRRGPPVAIAGVASLIASITMAFTMLSNPFVVGICAVCLCWFSISVHALMSGTAAADFGGRKATATASGITDGFVYLGSGLQSISLGYLTTQSWVWLPVFVIPFIIASIYLAVKMWEALPEATRRYILQVEKLQIRTGSISLQTETVKIYEGN